MLPVWRDSFKVCFFCGRKSAKSITSPVNTTFSDISQAQFAPIDVWLCEKNSLCAKIPNFLAEKSATEKLASTHHRVNDGKGYTPNASHFSFNFAKFTTIPPASAVDSDESGGGGGERRRLRRQEAAFFAEKALLFKASRVYEAQLVQLLLASAAFGEPNDDADSAAAAATPLTKEASSAMQERDADGGVGENADDRRRLATTRKRRRLSELYLKLGHVNLLAQDFARGERSPRFSFHTRKTTVREIIAVREIIMANRESGSKIVVDLNPIFSAFNIDRELT